MNMLVPQEDVIEEVQEVVVVADLEVAVMVVEDMAVVVVVAETDMEVVAVVVEEVVVVVEAAAVEGKTNRCIFPLFRLCKLQCKDASLPFQKIDINADRVAFKVKFDKNCYFIGT